VDDAAHLDAVAAAAGSAVVCLFLYSRSCGTCREMRRVFADLASEAAASGARCVFVQHDVRDAFDEPSDLARLHRVRSVPTVLFFGGGAAVGRCALADSRVVAPTARGAGGARRWLKATLTEVLLRQAPSARR
jgi:thiol:disulfide interchange protein